MINHFKFGNYKRRYSLKIFAMSVFFLFFLSVLFFEFCEQVDGEIIHVGGTEPEGYSTIQEAIDAATISDTVYVYEGVYYENIVIDKSINLVGENSRTTIIDGRIAGNTIKVNADFVTIERFTIMHSGLIYPNSGINLSSNHNTIKDNIIQSNFYGMTLYYSSNNTILRNTIQNDDHCGIYLSASSNNSISNNTIKNHNYNGVGVYYSSDGNIIENNTFISNDFCGVNIRVCKNNMVLNNNFTDNYIGVHIPDSSNIVDGNVFSGNNIDVEKESFLSESESFLAVNVVIILIIIIVVFYIFRFKKRK